MVWTQSNRPIAPLNVFASAAKPGNPAYNSLYPLGVLHYGDNVTDNATARAARIQLMIDSGITGLIPPFFNCALGTEFAAVNDSFLQDASGKYALNGNPFVIAPLVQVSDPTKLAPIVANYLTQLSLPPYSGYSSAVAKVGSAVVFMNFNPGSTQTGLTSDPEAQQNWDTYMSAHPEQFWIGQLQTSIGGALTNGHWPAWTSWQARTIGNLSSHYGAYYTFDNLLFDGTNWSDVVDIVNNPMSSYAGAPKPYAGGILSGYDRENVASGGYTDSRATAAYREGWESIIAAGGGYTGARWTTVLDWDDFSERHNIGPSSDWNWTRADITAWYAHKFWAASSLPSRLALKANLYVTTPQRIRINDTVYSEGLALNDTADTCTLTIQMVTNSGTAWGSPITTSVAPHSLGEVDTGSLAPTAAVTGNFLRCVATLTDTVTSAVQTVTSAPILVYPSATPTVGASLVYPVTYVGGPVASVTQSGRKLYYSIPAYNALPTAGLAVSLNADPSSGPLGTVTASVSLPSGVTPVYSEVLQNTYQVKNLFNASSPSCTVPLEFGDTTTISEIVSTDPWGFYVARVIDKSGSLDRVGYSDPVYYSPPMNKVLEPGFEASMSHWFVAGDTSATTTFADYTDTSGIFHFSKSVEGTAYGLQNRTDGANYSTVVSQHFSSLDSTKTYTAIAWVKSSGDHNSNPISTFEVSNGTTYLFKQIARTNSTDDSQWRMLRIDNLAPTAAGADPDALKIIFRTAVTDNSSTAKKFTEFDNVWLYKTGSAPATVIPSDPDSTETPTLPLIPSPVGDGFVKLTWNPVPGATAYNVKLSTSATGTYSTIFPGGLENTSYTATGLTNGTTYYFKISGVNAAGESLHDSAYLSATPFVVTTTPSDVIIDNAGSAGATVTKTGTWISSTAEVPYYGADYLHDDNTGSTTGGSSVKFVPDALPRAGKYEVFVMWSPFGNRAQKVPIDVVSNCATTIFVNQQTTVPGDWYSLGTYTFPATHGPSVTVRNDGANGYVIADAVKFVWVP